MAGERSLPGLGLTGFWDLGSEYKDQMDANLRLLSALVQASVISVVDPLPGAPTNGDIHLVAATNGSNPNQIAVRDNGAWVYLVPQEGWKVWNRATDEWLVYDGTAWAVDASGGMTGAQIVAAIDSQLGNSDWQTRLNASQVEALYEGLANTNKFTDAEKSKLAGLSGPLFKGTYLNLAALQAAHPTPDAGSYAFVDAGAGVDAVLHIWDADEGWVASSGSGGGTLTGAEIKTLYEAEPDTNALTDALLAKLNAIEAGATGDLTGAEIEAILDAYFGNTDWRTGGGGGGGATAFTGLTDTPANYTGQAGKVVKVNAGATGLEFADAPAGGDIIVPYYDFQNLTSTANSTSAFASKGTVFSVSAARRVFRASSFFTGVSGQQVKLVIAEVTAANPHTITAIVHNGTSFDASVSGEYSTDINPAVLLEAGKTYAFIWVRTDGTATSALNVVFPSAVGDPDPTGALTHQASIQFESNNPQVSDNTYHSNTSAVRFTLGLIDATLLDGLQGGGSSLPAGGTTGQVLAKASNTDGDVAWVDVAGGGAVAVNDEGVEVVAAASRLNFVGPNVTVTDAGGGEVTVTIGDGGTPAADPTYSDHTTNNTAVATLPATVDEGDLLIATIGGGSNNGFWATPAGWTPLDVFTDYGRAEIHAFYRVANGTEGGTQVTFTPENAFPNGATVSVVRIPGADPENPIALSAITGLAGNTTNAALPAITPTEAGQMILAFVVGGWGGPYTATWPAPYTEIADYSSVDLNDNGCVQSVAYIEAAAAAEYSGTVTLSAGLNYGAMQIVINKRPAVAAPGGTMTGVEIEAALDTYYGNTDWRTGGLTGAQIAVALDTALGSTTWREGLATPANLNAMSDVAVDTSTLTANDQGAALTYDHNTQQWVAGKSGFDTLRLGGGMELIAEFDLTVDTLPQLFTEASHGIDKYDEIVIVGHNVTGAVRARISSDGGSTWETVTYWRIFSDTAGDGAVWPLSDNGPYAGGVNATNLAQTYGIYRICGFSDPNLRTLVYAEGASNLDQDGATNEAGVSDTTSRINAIQVYNAASTGTVQVIGIKKSRQPLEYYGGLAGSPSVSGTVIMGHTLGCKFRSGVIGKAIVDVAPGADMTVEIRNGAGTVIATGIILAAATECDLTAASTATVTDRVVGAVVTNGTSAQAIDFIVRGEVA